MAVLHEVTNLHKTHTTTEDFHGKPQIIRCSKKHEKEIGVTMSLGMQGLGQAEVRVPTQNVEDIEEEVDLIMVFVAESEIESVALFTKCPQFQVSGSMMHMVVVL